MKKDNIRNLAFLVLITVSLFSYSYLSCVSQDITSETSTTRLEQEKDTNHIYVPDIALIKKIIQVGSTVFGNGL